MRHAEGRSLLPGKGEPGRVMQNQNGRGSGSKAASGSLKVSGQNPFLADAGIRQKTIGRFGVRPILARQRDTFSQPGRELWQQLLPALTQPLAWQGTGGESLVDSPGCLRVRERKGLLLTRKRIW